MTQCLGSARTAAKKQIVRAHRMGLCPLDPVIDVILFNPDITDQIPAAHFVAGRTSIEHLEKIHRHVLGKLFDDGPRTHHEAACRPLRELAVPHQLKEIVPDYGVSCLVAFFDHLLKPLRIALQVHQRAGSYKLSIYRHVKISVNTCSSGNPWAAGLSVHRSVLVLRKTA